MLHCLALNRNQSNPLNSRLIINSIFINVSNSVGGTMNTTLQINVDSAQIDIEQMDIFKNSILSNLIKIKHTRNTTKRLYKEIPRFDTVIDQFI